MAEIPQQEWLIVLHPDFDAEFDALPLEVQDGLLAVLRLLGDYRDCRRVVRRASGGDEEKGEAKAMSTLTERLAALPPARRRKVERRYGELKAEYLRLDQLRKSLGLTQAALARKLKVKQPRISKIERGPDAVLETMRR